MNSRVLWPTVALLAAGLRAGELEVGPITAAAQGNGTRITIALTTESEFKAERIDAPERLFIDIRNARLRRTEKGPVALPVGDSQVRRVRMAQKDPQTVRVVLDLERARQHKVTLARNPPRIVVDIVAEIPVSQLNTKQEGPKRAAAEPSSVRAPAAAPGAPRAALPKDEAGESAASAVETPAAKPAKQPAASLTRALGLKLGRILIDAGHGGHDQGTSGPTGLLEKELVLDVAMRLGALVEERLGSEVVYTRSSDVYVGLEERAASANRQRADLFISIHANSSPYRGISGAETFYLHYTGSRAELETAARENAGTSHTVFELRELAQKIALADKRDESIRFATQVQNSLAKLWGKANDNARNRGVKRAPFVVLIGAGMPAVLAEIGFVSNPADERLLRTAEFRDKLAEALFDGISGYAASLSQPAEPRSTRASSSSRAAATR